MSDWQDKAILNPGESLRIDTSRCEGFMQETDVYYCSVIDANGAVVGKVKATDHTAVRGFRRTLSVQQTNASGQTVVDERWSA
ncbi:MAG: hypothetical protein FHP94_00325 [Denitromonas halophila]|nr:MAG: hypothetical protein FHP94_00325 [Denitromonas halophila]TVT69219.1 MAG: hypothetical protein FHP93_13550 [Denitromonas halophila]